MMDRFMPNRHANVCKAVLIMCILIVSTPIHAQWEETNGPAGSYVRSLAYDGTIQYAATGGGVLVSADLGDSWEFRNTGLGSCDCKSLAVQDGYIIVSTDEGVFRSGDQGMSWERAGGGRYIDSAQNQIVHSSAGPSAPDINRNTGMSSHVPLSPGPSQQQHGIGPTDPNDSGRSGLGQPLQ